MNLSYIHIFTFLLSFMIIKIFYPQISWEQHEESFLKSNVEISNSISFKNKNITKNFQLNIEQFIFGNTKNENSFFLKRSILANKLKNNFKLKEIFILPIVYINNIVQTDEQKYLKRLLSLIVSLFSIFLILSIFLFIQRIKREKELKRQYEHLELVYSKLIKKQRTIEEQKVLLRKSLKQQELNNKKLSSENLFVEQKSKNIESFSKKIEFQKQQIENLYKSTKSAINYAMTIQKALLPKDDYTQDFFDDSFLAFDPHSEISGDFYYFENIKNHKIFAIADCTGHGVAGGFLTVIGITFLHEIINNNNFISTAQILEDLRKRVKKIFETFGNKNQNGIDISLCAYNLDDNSLQFSGAFNNLYLIRDGKLTIHKGVRNPIGFFPRERNFSSTTIQLQTNDLVYLMTDGFQDQNGGPEGKRITSRVALDLLKTIQHLPLEKQKMILTDYYYNWKNDGKRVDDYTILGTKWNFD